MTTRQVVTSFFDYHRWANERLLDAVAKVDEGDLLHEEGIPFGNVQGNMLHILGSQVSWIMRLTGQTPELAKIEPGRAVSGLRQSFGWAHDTFARYLASLTDEDIERVISFIDFEGQRPHDLQRPLWEILLSVGSHGMTHRSEVAIVLTRLGASPEQMDYSEYAWRHDLRAPVLTQKGIGQ